MAMKRPLIAIVAVVVWSLALRAQEPAFDAASVKPSPPPETTPVVSAGPQQGGRWIATNADIIWLVRGAYPEFAMRGRIVAAPGVERPLRCQREG